MHRFLFSLILSLVLAFPALAQIMLGGSGAPVNSTGSEGQFYFNTTNGNIYGPKTFGVWPLPTVPTYPAPSSGCTTLNLFYNNAGSIACMSNTSWNAVSGNLGIGIAPVALYGRTLHLHSTVGASINMTGTSLSAFIAASDAVAQLILATQTNHPIVFYVNNVEHARVTTTGFDVTGAISSTTTVNTPCTTIAGLGAAGTAGRHWCINDQAAACPALGGTFTAGGAIVCSAFDNGTAWVHE